MRKEAYENSTIKYTAKRLKHINKYCTLANPEVVKTFVANKKCSNAYKESLIEAYAIYMRSIGQKWNQPFYNRYDEPIKVPSEEKVNMLIAYAPRKMALMLSLSRDLGTRPIELTWIKVSHIDFEQRLVRIIGAKHTVGRIGKIKPNTLDMLKIYVNQKHLNADDRLFTCKASSISDQYRRYRNRLTEKLQDPSFKTIRLYDFRHFKASKTYSQTNSIMHVKETLGHKDIRTTMRYIHLFNQMTSDEFHCATAQTVEEIKHLIENGFEYIAEKDGTMLFRKRK